MRKTAQVCIVWVATILQNLIIKVSGKNEFYRWTDVTTETRHDGGVTIVALLSADAVRQRPQS